MPKVFQKLNREDIADFGYVLSRISPYILPTPLVKIEQFDKDTGHNVLFKLENLQSTGSFKSRGVISYIQHYLQSNNKPNKFVTYGTGNHAAALAWAGQIFNFKSHIFLSKSAEKYKMNLIEKYGGLLTICEGRKEAERLAFEESQKDNNVLVPTADNMDIILGAGTILYESIQHTHDNFDAVFLPIGGGSLASGSLIVKDVLNLKIKIFAGEPLAANDVAISLKQGKLFKFDKDPETGADAAKSLGVSENIYNRIKSLDDVYEISEPEILYWTNYFSEYSPYSCEPTSALAIASAYKWLQHQNSRKTVVIIISGDNVRSYLKNITNLDPKSFYESLA